MCSFNENTIYAFAGTDGYTPLNSIEKYSETTKNWILLPPISQMNYGVARIDGFAHQISSRNIIIFGGKRPSYMNAIVECSIFNIETMEFKGGISMKAETAGSASICLLKDRIYVLGISAQWFDCRERKWNFIL